VNFFYFAQMKYLDSIRTFIYVLSCKIFDYNDSTYGINAFCYCVIHYFLNCSYMFDKIRFPMFMHIKAPDENVLAQLIPEVWWDSQVLYIVHRFLFSVGQLFISKVNIAVIIADILCCSYLLDIK